MAPPSSPRPYSSSYPPPPPPPGTSPYDAYRHAYPPAPAAPFAYGTYYDLAEPSLPLRDELRTLFIAGLPGDSSPFLLLSLPLSSLFPSAAPRPAHGPRRSLAARPAPPVEQGVAAPARRPRRRPKPAPPSPPCAPTASTTCAPPAASICAATSPPICCRPLLGRCTPDLCRPPEPRSGPLLPLAPPHGAAILVVIRSLPLQHSTDILFLDMLPSSTVLQSRRFAPVGYVYTPPIICVLSLGPSVGFVGEADRNNDNTYFLFTHKNIVIRYNGNQIIHVNLTQESPKLIDAGKALDMTYSVKWELTDITFAHHFDVYLDHPFFEHQIHWFSIFNSFMMVIFLTGIVSMILMRTLRNDYSKYARDDDDIETLERDVNEESGWKLVHDDLFRPPRSLFLLSALVGIDTQLTALILLRAKNHPSWYIQNRNDILQGSCSNSGRGYWKLISFELCFS